MTRLSTTFLVALLAVSAMCFAQTKQKLTLVKQSEPLLKATGWKQNKSTDKLIANDNLIADKMAGPMDSPVLAGTPQNFIWMKTATLSYGGRKYVAFIYHYLGGQYKYPDTKVGWSTYTATRFVVVDSVQYGEFRKSALGKRGAIASGRSRISAELRGPYDEKLLLDSMSTAFDNKAAVIYYCFNAKTQLFDGREIARFRMPETCNNNGLLPTEFFEVGYEDFKKMLVE